jgi:ferrous iron transport protein B
LVVNNKDILDQIQKSSERLKKIFGEDTETIIADQRYGFITGITKKVVTKPLEKRLDLTDRIDEIVTNRVLGIPIFLFSIWVMFQATFSASEPFMHLIETAQEWLGQFTGTFFSEGSALQGLIVDGVIGGVGSVLVFVPVIFLLFFFMAILEDSGYMARAAFIMDSVMQKIGLHGKAFIPMILGFGCGLPGILATRTIETKRDRFITLLVVPFISCGARLPIYTLFIGAFFSTRGGTVLFSLYLLGILAAIMMAKILGKFALPGEPAPLLLELPPYRMPHFKGIMIHTWERGKVYLKKAGTIILAGCVIVWFISNFPWTPAYSKDYEALIETAKAEYETMMKNMETGSPQAPDRNEAFEEAIADLENERASEKLQKSYAGRLGRIIEPAVRPLGFDWKIGVSLIGGVIGKEIVVGTLGTLHAVGHADETSESLRDSLKSDTWPDGSKVYTPLTAFALMVFCLLYMPCVAAIGVIFQETKSWKWTVFAATYTTAFAWIVCLVIYQGGRLLGLG